MPHVLIYPNNQADDGSTIDGFIDFETAKQFAVRNVRSSIEEYRSDGKTAEVVKQAWMMFGDNAIASGDNGESFRIDEADLETYFATPATDEQRDWESLRP